MTPQSSSPMGFVEKFGLKYYFFLINIVVYVGVLQLTKSIQMVTLAVIIIPRLGSFFPKDDQPKNKNNSEYNKNCYHMFAPVLFVFCTYFIFFYTWANYEIIGDSWQSFISCIIAIPFTVGQSIDGDHELIHRNQFILRLIGFIGLIPFQFTTYPVEHLYMHHKHVGSPQDAITSPKNQSFYKYYVKAIYSSYKQTFKYSKLWFALCLILNWSFLYAIYQASLSKYQGDSAKAFQITSLFVCVAAFALFAMESVEYIEHYGLVYRKNQNDKPVLEISSWNTAINPLYNWITFRFQRHSDHHMNAYKIYSSMELNQKMPLYPFTFVDAISACWYPFIWYKIADHLADKVMKNEKFTQEDIQQSQFWIQITSGLTALPLVINAYTAYF